jgi:hypothetical protein
MTQPDDGLPEEIGAAMTEAGFAPTLPSLKELIANAAHEHEAKERRQQWPLLGLIPSSVNAEVARRAADQGLLVAERVGGRWFCTRSTCKFGSSEPADGFGTRPRSDDGVRWSAAGAVGTSRAEA